MSHSQSSCNEDNLTPSLMSLFGPGSSQKKKPKPDRFMPDIVGTKLYDRFRQDNDKQNNSKQQPQSRYAAHLEQHLFKDEPKKILNFKGDMMKENGMFYSSDLKFSRPIEEIKKQKKISLKPYKQLSAPNLRDDFYLNLLDWSSYDQIGAGLREGLIVWSGCLSKVEKIYQPQQPSNFICSVAFPKFKNQIGFGDSKGKVRIFDITKKSEVISIQNFSSNRVGSLACTSNMLCTGSKNGMIEVYDFRQCKAVTCWKAHDQQICGIKWSHDGQMIASGGNDNKMNLFSLKTMTLMAEFRQHKAAVKALAFDPSSPIVASGGGSADKHIRFFSTQTLEQIYSKDTGSQICNIMFSPISRELVTTHGFSLNQINVYRIDKESKVTKTATLTGHQLRVLYLAGESHGPRIVTGAGDQSLKFWNVFQEEHDQSEHFDLR